MTRRDRRPPLRWWPVLAAALVGLAGCGSASPGGTAASTWSVGATPATGETGVRAQLGAALRAQGLFLEDAKVPFRPAEPPDLASVPRSVYQAQLRDDPTGGFIVAYDLGNAQVASTAGSALSAYLSSGPGRVQSPLGTVHVIRQVGSTLVYYRWLPAGAKDPLTPGIQVALETIGTGVPVAS
jgi:hypothetical protein